MTLRANKITMYEEGDFIDKGIIDLREKKES